jgi:hypothetical protein
MRHFNFFVLIISIWAALLAIAFTVGTHYLGFDRTAAAVAAGMQSMAKQLDWDREHNRLDR